MPSSAHLSMVDLMAYFDATVSPEEARTILAHLETCDLCRAQHDEFCAFQDELEDPEFAHRPVPDTIPEPSEQQVEEFRALASRLDVEDAEAGRLLPFLLTGSPDDWRTHAAQPSVTMTWALIHHLLDEGHRFLTIQPSHALDLALFAGDCCAYLPDATSREQDHKAHFTGLAFKEKANALRMLGRLPEATHATETATLWLLMSTNGEFEVAGVQYIRAAILWSQRDLVSARRVVRASAKTFALYGDSEQCRKSEVLEAGILYEMGQVAEARDLALRLLKSAQTDKDLALQARLCANLAQCVGDLGDPEGAGNYYLTAMSLYDELGLKTENVRLRWSLGDLTARTGRPNDGLILLERAERDFEDLGMLGEAGMVALSRAELLLTAGHFAEVATICHTVIARFEKLGAAKNALQALEYLREAMVAGRSTPVLIREVREFLQHLPTDPSRAFEPPPPIA